MAKRQPKYLGLRNETRIEVIAISKSGDVYKIEKTITEFNQMKKSRVGNTKCFNLDLVNLVT